LPTNFTFSNIIDLTADGSDSDIAAPTSKSFATKTTLLTAPKSTNFSPTSHGQTQSRPSRSNTRQPPPAQELANLSASGIGLGLSEISTSPKPRGSYHTQLDTFAFTDPNTSEQARRQRQNGQAANHGQTQYKKSGRQEQIHVIHAAYESPKRKAEEGFQIQRHMASLDPTTNNEMTKLGDGRNESSQMSYRLNRTRIGIPDGAIENLGATPALKRVRTSVTTYSDSMTAGSRAHMRATSANPIVPHSTTARLLKTAKPQDTHGRAQFDDLLKSAEAKVVGLNKKPPHPAQDFHAAGITEANQLASFSADKAASRPSAPTYSTTPQDSPILRSSTQSSQEIGLSRSDLSPSCAFFPTRHSPAGVESKPRIVPLVPRVVLGSEAKPNFPASIVASSTLSSAFPSLSVPSLSASSAAQKFSPTSSGRRDRIDSHRLSRLDKTAPRFTASRMPEMKGHPFTLAELIVVGYLQEERGMSWSEVDYKMGRTTNSCATKYLRKPHGLKNPQVKKEFFYQNRIAALEAIIFTLDPDIQKVIAMLEEYISTGTLPSAACDSLNNSRGRAHYASPRPSNTRPNTSKSHVVTKLAMSLPRAVSLQRDLGSFSNVPKLPQESLPHGSFESRLRPSARTAAGDLAVRKFFKPLPQDSYTPPEEISCSGSVMDASSDGFPSLPIAKYPAGSYVKRKKPYLSFTEREAMKESVITIAWRPGELLDWKDISVHVDFNDQELADLYYNICTRTDRSDFDTKKSIPELIAGLAPDLSAAKIRHIVGRAKRCGLLKDRSSRSIETFLFDAGQGSVLTAGPTALRIQGSSLLTSLPIRRHLLKRELGQLNPNPHRKIKDTVHEVMNPVLSFTGASGDIGTLAWSPNGNLFAAGAACLVDEDSMQYNRPNNLLFGDVARSRLFELPHHSRPRGRTKMGANSTSSMYMSQDPRLFETVSMVDFAHDGSFMYSAGYDHCLRAYELEGDKPKIRWESDHGAKLDLLTSSRHASLVAIGCQSNEDSVKVYRNESGQFDGPLVLKSQRLNPEKKTSPSCLRWGVHSFVQNYLLAGFAAVNDDVQYGETCLWDIERKIPITVSPSAGTVFDCNWSPTGHVFATACAAHGTTVNRGVHSLIRIYSAQDDSRWSKGVELDCTARDINDVLFCPHDQNYVTAGATDGKIYVWDIRNPHDLLHKFKHGPPIMELDPAAPRELSDTGVRFCAWNHDRSQLHTGSSDGIVKIWDIFRSSEDAFVRDTAMFNSGVYSGAFSADFSSLLIGEINGSLSVLEAGQEPLDDVKQFDLEGIRERPFPQTSPNAGDTDSGVKAAKALRKSKHIKIRPLGGLPVRQAVQGKNYDGPYDKAPDANNLRALAAEFQSRMKAPHPDSYCRISLCKSSAIRVTAEEDGDSGRAVDRIPQALRQSTSHIQESKMITGMMKCSHCGSSARPRLGDYEQELFPLCERCGFSCFRCGKRVKVLPDAENVRCRACDLTWDAGGLGYDLIGSIKNGGKKGTHSGAKSSSENRTREQSGGLEDIGDLLHLVEEYHHSLWEDTPSSPL
jgi:WD40 repeat protein